MAIQRVGGAVRAAACVALICVLAAASGCSSTSDRRLAWTARNDLVGMSRQELLACAETPHSSERDGYREYIYFVGKPAEATGGEDQTCVATFVLRNDVIDRIDYARPGGRLPEAPENCLSRFRPCLASLQ